MATKNPLVVASGQVQQLQSADVANIGYPVMGWKNKILNGNMEFWQRGTSFTNPGAVYTADRWIVNGDGTGGTIIYSREALSPGEISGAENLRYFYRNNCTSARSGATLNIVVQRVEGVRHLAGRTITISFWAKATASTALGLSSIQNFGTGGTPSSNVDVLTLFTVATLTTSWVRYSHTVAVPSINGKTLGTNGNDFINFRFHSPLDATYTTDITGIQVEESPVVTAFEERPLQIDDVFIRRYFRAISNNLAGEFTSSSIFRGTVYLDPPMRAVPSVSLSTTTPDVESPNVQALTGSSSGASLWLAFSVNGGYISITGFTGAATGVYSLLKTGTVYLDAEL